MDTFIKNIKKKLSVENLVDMMKESKVIDENATKEEDVRITLEILVPNALMDVNEIAAKPNEISDGKVRKQESSAGKKKLEAAESSVESSQSTTEKETPASNENEYLNALGREENVFNLYDDFH